MAWFSAFGTGASLYGIERGAEGRLRFTVWLSAFWVPLVPLSSWTARYVGESVGSGTEQGHSFADLVRTPHDWARIGKTYLTALVAVAAAVTPTAVMVVRTEGRAATPLEMVFVFFAALWPAGLILFFDYNRRRKLRGV